LNRQKTRRTGKEGTVSRLRRPESIAVRSLALLLGLWGTASATAPLLAQPLSSGPEFQVNGFTTGNQQLPRVATNPEGAFVVVWQSGASSGSDGDSWSIQAQRYSADGQPASGQFQVNTYTTGMQTSPDVALAAAGGFVVVWRSEGSFGSDSDTFSIQARRYAANGGPLGDQFQVNTYTTGGSGVPRVASDAAGAFVVVWENGGSGGSDHSSYSIQARRYAADGTPQGDQFQVNTYTMGVQYGPDVAAADDGRFVVVWTSDGSAGSDQSGRSIHAQRFAANGSFQSAELQVNSYTTGNQNRPAVACDSARNFVVAWDSEGSQGSDTSLHSIQARRYAANGGVQGGQFQVNTYTTGDQAWPSVAADADRDFAVVWYSEGSTRDGSGRSVQSRWYAPDGTPWGAAELQINTWTTGQQDLPDVASDALGDIVVVWQSDGSSGTDHDGISVHGRRYDGLFRDGFETGDTIRWSDAVP
jgi:hypothetical protein